MIDHTLGKADKTMTPKHPQITVQFTGHDGNAFAILGRCRKAAREAGLRDREINAFVTEATSGDYDHLLQTAIHWFDVQ
jgi:hypothetical protein